MNIKKKSESDFYNNSIRDSADSLSSENIHSENYLNINTFMFYKKCANSIQQVKKQLFKKIY